MSKGLKRGALRNCVVDFCSGMSKEVERKIIKMNKKEDKKIIIKKIHKVKNTKGTQVTCSLYADPHVKGTNNKYFDAQTVGDWVLYKGDELSASYRGVQNGRWVAAVKFSVRLFSDKIYSNGFDLNTLIINGKEKLVHSGVTRISKKRNN